MASVDRRMWTQLLFILIHLFTLFTGGEGCNDSVSVLPSLQRRSRIDLANNDVPFVDDLYLDDGWYRASSEHTTYVMVTNATLPPPYSCGSPNQIYMLGNVPDITTLTHGDEKDFVACMQSSVSICDIKYNIKIRHCAGELQYFLTVTQRNAAYCFDRPEIAGRLTAPTDARLGNIKVTPGLHFRKEVSENDVEFYNPSLVFECVFEKQANYYYQVEWFYNDHSFVTLGPTSNVTELILHESVIQQYNITLGVTFRCGVSVSVDLLGMRTQVQDSPGLFAGILFDKLTMTISKTSDAVITFKLTVPIGCQYIASSDVDDCIYDLHMFDRQYNCSAKKGAIQEVKRYPRRCASPIQALKVNSTFNPDKKYSYKIATKDETYNDRNTFSQEFVMEKNIYLGLWSGYSPHDVTIIVVDEAISRVKYCYTHVDPHYKTTDGARFDQHSEGFFMLYRNKKYDIMVQEQTKDCTVNDVTCTCAVAVKAGADLVLFNTCHNDHNDIGFKECGDSGILRTKKVTDALYEVHTPIGTYIRIALLSGYFEGMMNVDIYMSPKDFNNTEGLCGSFDNDPTNDYTRRDGTQLNNNEGELFSNSWRLNETENYFGYRYQTLTRWSQENDMFCSCEEDKDSKNGTDYTTCSASQYEDCHVVDEGETTAKWCTFASNVNKRSVSNHYKELKRRSSAPYDRKRLHRTIKKSIESITETEATETCTKVLNNSLVATDFTGFIAPGEVEAKISQCIFDVLATNDMSAAEIHFDSLNGLVSFNLDKDPDYVENNAEQVQNFKQQSCSRNCSGQGQCVNGVCDCAIHLHGAACTIDERDTLTIDAISGGGLCDSISSECTCFTISTQNLIDPFKFRYNMSHLSSDGQYIPLGTATESGQYMSKFAGLLCVPEPPTTDTFVRHYSVAISNDGSAFSSPVEMHVYDSTCQQYMLDSYGTYRFLVKSAYCRINGRCYRHNDQSANNSCNYCNTKANNTTWTQGCTEKPDSDNDSPTVIIIFVVITSICLVAIVACVCCLLKGESRHPINRFDLEVISRPSSSNFAASREDVSLDFLESRQNNTAAADDGCQGLNSRDETPEASGYSPLYETVTKTIEEYRIAADNERQRKAETRKDRRVKNTSECDNTILDDSSFSRASYHVSTPLPVTNTIGESDNEAIGPALTHVTPNITTKRAETTDQSNEIPIAGLRNDKENNFQARTPTRKSESTKKRARKSLRKALSHSKQSK